MRSDLYRLIMIGVSDEQPPRGRFLKPRQKSEKKPANRRAGEIGHEFRRDNSAAARDCPIRTSRIGRGSVIFLITAAGQFWRHKGDVRT
jgi:hypothetical protein